MNPGLEAILSRRLLIVTGKGGTGKTTLAAALGMLAARHRRDAVVVEVGDSPELPPLLGGGPSEGDGRAPVQVAPFLHTLRIRPEISLAEYLELQLRVRTVVRFILGQSGFRRLLDAAPGWRALITLGKLWHLQSRLVDGRPRWPLLIIDAPATGHGLSFLSVPNVVLDTVKLGPLRHHTEAVQKLLQDPLRTWVLPVTLAEELPVNETLELCDRVRELGLALGPMFANAIEPPTDVPELDRVLDTLRSANNEGGSVWSDPEVLRTCAEHQNRRAELQRGFLDQLDKETPAPPVRLPYLAEGIDGPVGIVRLAEHLEEGLSRWESS